jgi:hypothetical protein
MIVAPSGGTPMTQPVCYVAFTPEGATHLREALRHAGRDERVIGFPDDLRFGPIDGDDSAQRGRWIKTELGLTGWDDIAAESNWFWQQALSSDHRMIAWFSRRSAREYVGLLKWLWRRGEKSCDVIDLTDRRLPQFSMQSSVAAPVASLAHADFERIYDDDLFVRTEIVTVSSRAGYQTLWRRLRQENGALRVFADDALVSAPISFFDVALLSEATGRWLKVARIVGATLTQTAGEISDLFLAARVDALVASGRLERQGRSAVDMRRCEVRLPEVRPAPAG